MAEKINATIPETSRHLGRLKEAKVIDRKSDGSYSVTTYGRLVFLLLSSFSFLSKTREYFLSHDISFLPQEFIERIRELSTYAYTPNVSYLRRIGNDLIPEPRIVLNQAGDRPIVYFHAPNSLVINTSRPSSAILLNGGTKDELAGMTID